MLKRLSVLALLIVLVIMSATAHAESRLNGRSRLELGFGYGAISSGGSDVSVDGTAGSVDISYDANGFLGSLGYSMWLQEDLAVLIAITGLSVGTNVDVGICGVSTSTLVVSKMQLGMRYYLSGKNPQSPARPFLAIAAGPVIGTLSETKVGASVVVSSQQESAVGAYVGGGLDIISGRKVMFGAAVGYNLMTDFSDDLAMRKNYGGPEFSLSISLLFGQAKQPG